MTLIELQRDLRDWLAREDDDAASRLGGEHIAAGLSVYQNNFRAQLVACLEESFAQTRAWIGDAAFHAAAVAHIERVPPHSWTLDAYPRDFPATLALLHPTDPEIAELATLELALTEAFVAPDAVPVDAATLGDIDWDRAILGLTPTLDLAGLTTNAPEIWSALAEQREPPAVALLTEPGAVLVWRTGEAPHFRAIGQIERQSLLLVRAGTPFAELCALLAEALGKQEGTACAGQMLGQWLADGLIVSVAQ